MIPIQSGLPMSSVSSKVSNLSKTEQPILMKHFTHVPIHNVFDDHSQCSMVTKISD